MESRGTSWLHCFASGSQETLGFQETQKTDPNPDRRERTARRGASLDKMILVFNVRDEEGSAGKSLLDRRHKSWCGPGPFCEAVFRVSGIQDSGIVGKQR